MTKTIYVVDDDPSVTSIFEFILQQAGYTVRIAQTGEECIEWFTSGSKPDLLFLDCKLPGLSGLDTLKKIMEIQPFTLAIMVSGFMVEPTLNDALEAGAYSVVYKPFDVEEILMVVEKIFKMPALH
jgi:two-component system response regulator AtoC